MSEQRTITQSEYRQIDRKVGHNETRAVLAELGITVVPDPALVLPTKPGAYADVDGDHWLLTVRLGWITPMGAPYADPENGAPLPFQRLYTAEERDKEVFTILRNEYGSNAAGWWIDDFEDTLNEVRERDPK